MRSQEEISRALTPNEIFLSRALLLTLGKSYIERPDASNVLRLWTVSGGIAGMVGTIPCSAFPTIEPGERLSFLSVPRNQSTMTEQDLRSFAQEVHADAVAHGLYDAPVKWHGNGERAQACRRILDEVSEAYDAVADVQHYTEELADIVLVTLSLAEHMGLDIASAIMHKVEVNKGRPYGHREGSSR